jgi:ankyrin repeat protein
MSVVEALRKQGANINYRGSEGKTPLSHEIIQCHSNIAKRLLSRGADIMNHCDNLFHTALHDAAQVDLDDIAPLLLQHGADINQWGFERWSPLMWATPGLEWSCSCRYSL